MTQKKSPCELIDFLRILLFQKGKSLQTKSCSFVFLCLCQTDSSERLRIFYNIRTLRKYGQTQDENVTPINLKKLAGIYQHFEICQFSARVLLVFVSRHSKQIKIKIKTVQQIKSGIWEMKGGKYTKTLAKIQVRGIFRIRDIRRNVLPKFIEICMETPCWCSSG